MVSHKNHIRILIAEDEFFIRKLVQAILSQAGFDEKVLQTYCQQQTERLQVHLPL